MSDNKKYYYLKLKDSFFDGEEMILLQNMKDGYLYTDILLKLYLRSLKCEGKLMFKNLIPYTPEALSQVTRHQVGTVEKALKVFKQMGLIEVLDNGAIYMMDIQNFIGQSSTESDRIRAYRKRVAGEKALPSQCDEDVQKCDTSIDSVTNVTTNVLQMNNIITPEIEKEIDIEIKKKIEKESQFSMPLKLKLEEWLEYKKERQENYKTTGLKTLISTVRDKLKEYSENEIIEAINLSMSNGWKGIIWNEIKKQKQGNRYFNSNQKEFENLDRFYTT